MVKVVLLLACVLLCAACGSTVENQVLPTRIALESPSSTVLPESVENTELPSAPQELQFWEAVSGTLSDASTPDAWKFIGQVGDNINLRAIAQGFEVTLVLISPDGTALRRGDNILYQLPTTGIYRVDVTSVDGQTGTYDLGLSYSDRQNPALASGQALPEVVGVPTPLPVNTNLGSFITEIADDQTVAGTFSTLNESHVYTFSGRAGEYLNLEMTRVSGELSPLIRLLSAEGSSLGVDNGSGGPDKAVIRNVLLPQDDLYIVQVKSNSEVGSYTLFADVSENFVAATPAVRFTPALTPVPPALTPTIVPYEAGTLMARNTLYRGRIREGDDFLAYYFSAEEGEVITIGVSPEEDGALIPNVELIDPTGVPVTVVSGLRDPATRNAVIRAFVVAETGSYTVLITSEGETTGRFVVSWANGTANEQLGKGEALLDRTNEGVLTASNVQDVWYVYLNEGAVVTASVEPLDSTVDTVVELMTDTGILVGISRDESGNRNPQITGVTVPTSGYYYLKVRASNETSLGRYGLLWRYVTVAPTPTPPEGSSALVTVRDRVADRAYGFYPFQGYAGQVIRVSVMSESENFDPVAVLLDQNADILVEVDDTDGNLNPSFTYTLPADGIYNVRVNGYQQGGIFQLLIEELF